MPSEQLSRFRIGRGHDSELRVNDVSVSRYHAILKFNGEHFFLEDNVSKFGTLVLQERPFKL